ncbi:MAG: hypothetical protein AMK71_01095 [Nitrospira bacterium SG8_35_4]|nr:MAG: hypothetical protein AMK71_01095 [Nitrospira bacterium SG8_35_4]
MNSAGSFFYNLILSLWIGGMSVFTFIITPVIFRAYERDMAGKIAGELFPSYFIYALVLSVLALLLLAAIRPLFVSWGFKLSMILVVCAILINIFTVVKLHPDIKKVKKEIHSFEAPADDSPLRKKFGRLHAISAVLNLLVLADGIALLFISSVMKRP